MIDLLLGLMIAMAPPANEVRASTPDARGESADIAEIRRLTQEFVEGFNSGDLDRVMRFYAEDYLDINMREPHQTNAERREYYRRIIGNGDARITVTPHQIVVAGDTAYAWGTILLSGPRAVASGRTELRYMEVLRRFPDGWRTIWGMDADIY